MAPAGGTPYLDHEDVSDQLPFLDPPESANIAQPSHSPYSRGFQLYALTNILSLIFLLDVSGTIIAAPAVRILESILCHDHYKKFDPSRIGNNGAVEEKYCKIDQVQEMVAFLNGWDTFFANLPGMMNELYQGSGQLSNRGH